MFLLWWSSLGFASTLTVGGNGTYSTIQAAISASSSGDVIDVQSGAYTECLTITHSLSFTGTGVTLTNNSCTDASMMISSGSISVSDWSFSSTNARAIYIDGSTTSLTLNDVTIDGSGSGSIDGGAVYLTAASLSIIGGTFENNTGEKGGIIYALGGTVSIADATFSYNTADAQGGVLYGISSVDVTISNSTFENNTINSSLSGFGGTMALISGCSLSVSNSSFTNGSTGSKGGVFHIDHGQSTAGASELSIVDSTFTGNSSSKGGVVYIKDHTDVQISGSTFESNSANKGGVIFGNGIGSDVEISNSVFDQNSTNLSGEGGVIALLGNGANKPSGIIITDSTFTNNSSESYGGAVSVGGPYTNTKFGGATITGSIFRNNSSVNSQSSAGGAVYVNTSSGYNVEVLSTIFEENSSSLSGGALYIAGANEATVSLVQFLSNEAAGVGGASFRYGGGLMVDGVSSLMVGNTIFGGNVVSHTVSSYEGIGGGLYVQSSSEVELYNVIFDQNTSTHKGGAFASDSNTSLLIQNNHFLSNEASDGGGLYLESTSSTIKNNIFAYHTGAAIYATASVSPTYNDWYQNSSDAGGSASFATSSSGNITSDPNLSGYTADGVFTDDYSLTSASALIDAGDPALFDTDGSVSDIGAFGGGTLLDSDGDGFSGIVDCNDLDGDTFPGSAENETNSSACMKDSDGDGYGDANASGSVTAGSDCDDTLSSVSPSAAEVCDGLDNNCDGTIDENTIDGSLWYQDLDGDGYGDASNPQYFCTDPTGYTEDGGDCDDQSFSTYPGAAENDSSTLCMSDADADGYGDSNVSGDVVAGNDCDDGDVSVNPDASEIAGDGIDQNCDGGDDCFRDVDGDGYGGEEVSAGFDMDCTDFNEAGESGDCDDADPNIHPGAAENDSPTSCMKDADGDGYGDAYASGTVVAGNDCNDDEASAYFGADEIVGDGIDQDCDFTEICYEDLDGDGYGTEQTIPSSDVDCDDESESGTADDCDGSDPQSYPGAADELGDGIDQDCDGVDGSGGTNEPGSPSSEPGSPSSEPGSPSSEPGNPSTEPSGEEIPDKSGCTHISGQEGFMFALLPLFGLLGRRR
jgi:predicted outer membrane repeat protein